jgi:hypothetical protein
MIDVVYGLPTYEMIQKSKNDEIMLGGYARPFAPTHYCLDCQEEHRVDTHTPTFSHNK